MPVYPIGFSIHSSKIVADADLDRLFSQKNKFLAPLIPGRPETYIYTDEVDYYQAYKTSWFALTCKKAGWDCMRHYEILACGCLPVFPDLDACPPNTMTHFPKDLVTECNRVYHYITSHAGGDNPLEVARRMNLGDTLVRPLLKRLRANLTNLSMSKYVLSCVSPFPFRRMDGGNSRASRVGEADQPGIREANPGEARPSLITGDAGDPNCCAVGGGRDVRRVLVLSGSIWSDYLRCTVLTGLKELLGSECHDYPRVPHLYTDFPKERLTELWGKGMSYSRILDPALHRDAYDATVADDIRHRRYDLIVYGSYHRGMPYWNEVNAAYAPSEVVLLCGEDAHPCDYRQYTDRGYHVFVREL